MRIYLYLRLPDYNVSYKTILRTSRTTLVLIKNNKKSAIYWNSTPDDKTLQLHRLNMGL